MENLSRIILQSCSPGILCFVFLSVFISFDKTFKPRVLRKFFLAIFSGLILLTADVIDYYFQLANINQKYWALLAAIGFSFRVGTIGFIATIANRRSMKFHTPSYALMVLNFIIAFASLKFGFYFRFDENFNWHIGPLFFIPYIIVAFYEFIILHSLISNIKANVTEAIMVLLFTISCVIANIMEIYKIQHIALSQTILICIVFYYLCLNIQLYRLDALTSLLNRRCLYADLRRLSNHKLILVSMNINDLDAVNKKKGYLEGDNVVVTCAQMMSDAFKSHALVYRANGDEFIAFFKNKTLDLATNCISKLQRKMVKSPYRIAVGFTEYFPGNDLEETIAVARDKMHENKELIKKNENKTN